MRRPVLAFFLVVALLPACTRSDPAARAGDASAPDGSPAVPVNVPELDLSAAPPPRAAPAPPPVTSVNPATLVWQPHRGDHFSILFPGEPKLKVLPIDEGKVSYTEAVYDVPGGQVSFAAGYTDHDPVDVAKPEAFLDERVNAPRRGQTDVLHKRSMMLDGKHPGRVLILRRNISGTPLRIYSRLYLVGKRLYSLIVSTLDEGGVSEDLVKKFMESFRLS